MKINVLVVAEKHSVAKAIATILSGGRLKVIKIYGVPVYLFNYKGSLWACLGVKGHLMDFDFEEKYNKWKNVDPKLLFYVRPIRVIREDAKPYVSALRYLGRLADKVILALDADVEGEGIAFEVMDIIRQVNPRVVFKRAWFSAITREDIINAFNNLRDPNPLLANKVFARMLIDLTIGAAFTRALTLAVEKAGYRFPTGLFLSYGPCQSPVLYLVVKRALEREQFKSKKYYVVEVEAASSQGRIKLTLDTTNKIEQIEEAKKIASAVKLKGYLVVKEASYTQSAVNPPVPLNTIDLERDASHYLNIRSKETLNLAEELYRRGIISYPRTETTIYPPTLNLRSILARFKTHPEFSTYARKLLSKPVLKPTKGRLDDKAHPPIYPIKSVPREYIVKTLGTKAWKIYEYIVRRFMATLSDPAIVERQKIVAEASGYKFKATGLKIIDPGFYEIYPYGKPKEVVLPKLKTGQILKIIRVKVVERKTPPPPYLSEADVLSLMRKYGIGTDATMQDHIHTNVKRKYFIIKQKKCIPTSLGKALIKALIGTVPELVQPEIRGKIEQELSRIASGESDPDKVVKEVKKTFLEYYSKLERELDNIALTLIDAIKEMGKDYNSSSKKAKSSRSTTKRK